MPLTASHIQLNLLQHSLDTLYARSSVYALRLALLDLDDKEKDLLVQQHRKQVVEQAMADIESTFGGWSITRDPAEAACP